MKLNNDTTKKELEDMVRAVLSRTWPRAPVGGPLDTETLTVYKERLFSWLVNTSKSEPLKFQELKSWCDEHAMSSTPAKKEKQEQIQDLLHIQPLIF